jgi:hypothetical protein
MHLLVQLLADILELILRWLTDDAFLSGDGQCLRGICNATLNMAARFENAPRDVLDRLVRERERISIDAVAKFPLKTQEVRNIVGSSRWRPCA